MTHATRIINVYPAAGPASRNERGTPSGYWRGVWARPDRRLVSRACAGDPGFPVAQGEPALQLLMLGVATGVPTFVLASVVVERLEPWRWVEHRGPLHAPIVLPLVGCVAWLLLGSVQLGLLVMTGWASHLIADTPTYRGLPLLWPYSKRMVHLTPAMLRWHSGTAWIEWPLALACFALSTRLTRP
jgi:LexA-binding, inner membrane-associated putative hydrolase